MDIQRIVLFAGLAIVSYLMVLAWNEDYNQPAEPVTVNEQMAGINETADDEMSLPERDGTLATSEEFSAPGEAGTASVTTISSEERLVTVTTDVLSLKIDRVGGHLVEASLLDYDRTLNSEEPLQLLQTSGNRTYFLESGMIGRDGFDSQRNNGPPIYQVETRSFALADGSDSLQVDLRHETEQGVGVIKRYSLARDSYEIEVEYLIDNRSDAPWQGNFTGKIVRDEAADPTAQNSMGIKAFLGLVVSTPDDPYEKLDLSDLRKDRLNEPVTNGWM